MFPGTERILKDMRMGWVGDENNVRTSSGSRSSLLKGAEARAVTYIALQNLTY
jgi:hypothetical protein